MKNFLKKIGGPLVWFGIPVYAIITYQLCKAEVHPLFVAGWCTFMAGFIGYSLCDDNVFKHK